MNIITSLLTPRKQHATPPPAPTETHDENNGQNEDSDGDDGRVSFDLSPSRPIRTPIASKRNTPRRQSMSKEMSLRRIPKKGLPAPPLSLRPSGHDRVEGTEVGHETESAAAADEEEEEEEGENKDKDEEEEEEEEDEDGASDASGEEYTIKRFLNHRWVENSIEIEVEWEGYGDETTWEPEVNLQADAPATLFAYWRSQKGGRPDNPYDPDMFEVFAIRKHSRDRKRFLVEWVGYEPKEASWVTRQALEETAGDVITEYWDNLDAKKK